MKRIVLFAMMFVAVSFAAAQQKYYDDTLDGMTQVREAVAKAQAEGKYVLCQVGGNWCPWCTRFAQFVEQDTLVHDVVAQNFVYIHINYSKENKNLETMKYLGNPSRFGFPVFVIVTGEGKPIHIQNSEYLEEGKGYSEKKVYEFLKQWTPAAVTTLP